MVKSKSELGSAQPWMPLPQAFSAKGLEGPQAPRTERQYLGVESSEAWPEHEVSAGGTSEVQWVLASRRGGRECGADPERDKGLRVGGHKAEDTGVTSLVAEEVLNPGAVFHAWLRTRHSQVPAEGAAGVEMVDQIT